jgi:hypothetical protein
MPSKVKNWYGRDRLGSRSGGKLNLDFSRRCRPAFTQSYHAINQTRAAMRKLLAHADQVWQNGLNLPQ